METTEQTPKRHDNGKDLWLTMNTSLGEDYIKYLEDFQSETFRYLTNMHLVFEFTYPYVNLHLTFLQSNINSGMDRSDALMLAKKEATALMDEACKELVREY